MNFPMEYPVFQFFYWLVNTAGLGGIFVLIAGAGSLLSYAFVLRWIMQKDQDEYELYSYPTPALHHEHEKEDAG